MERESGNALHLDGQLAATRGGTLSLSQELIPELLQLGGCVLLQHVIGPIRPIVRKRCGEVVAARVLSQVELVGLVATLRKVEEELEQTRREGEVETRGVPVVEEELSRHVTVDGEGLPLDWTEYFSEQERAVARGESAVVAEEVEGAADGGGGQLLEDLGGEALEQVVCLQRVLEHVEQLLRHLVLVQNQLEVVCPGRCETASVRGEREEERRKKRGRRKEDGRERRREEERVEERR